MAAELIGHCKCWNPKCGSVKARLTLAKSGLPVMTCNACNYQGFARGDRSDDGMRASLVTETAPPPADPPAQTPAPVPAPAPKPASVPWGIKW